MSFDDWVKATCVLSAWNGRNYLIVGLRNEKIVIHDLNEFDLSISSSSSNCNLNPCPVAVIDCHADTISSLVALPQLNGFVSASLDGSVLFWSAAKGFSDLVSSKEEARRENESAMEVQVDSDPMALTAEEEAELAELM